MMMQTIPTPRIPSPARNSPGRAGEAGGRILRGAQRVTWRTVAPIDGCRRPAHLQECTPVNDRNNPVRAELDTVPAWDPPVPAVSYVVCSTPRSGSALLCRGLASTGLAGIPIEYFNPHARRPMSRRWGTGASLLAYAQALRGARTGSNGVFGTKLHWKQLTLICAELPGHLGAGGVPSRTIIDELLPGSTFVRITRLDVEAQAVSLWVALNSREWWKDAAAGGPSEPPAPYSFSGIERCRAEIVQGVVGWHNFFAVNAITPIDVVYEELAANHAAIVRSTLEGILPGVEIPEIPPPEIARQSDEHSQALLARYRVARARRARQVARGGQLLLWASTLRRELRGLNGPAAGQ